MGRKLDLNERYIVDEYKKGKSATLISKELGVSKPTILKILNKHNVIKKRDRCKSLKIIKEIDKFIIVKKCPNCGKEYNMTSNNSTILCRNYFNSSIKKRLCRICLSKSMSGENNPFFGKKHTDKTKNKMSNNRKGKGVGNNNSMSNIKWKNKASQNLKKKWDSGEMEHVRKIMSDKLKETRMLGKITSVIRSKKEKEIINEIKNMGFKVTHSLKIKSKIYDIYIPKLNLVIEYNGDYWHCNPKKYNGDYYHQVKGKTAKEIWDYDKNKIDLIKLYGYYLEVIWESELKNDHTLINKIINKYDSKNRRTPESP
jgi:G:T-mismatch repair DNA endonuclease (very short patch repair protein)